MLASDLNNPDFSNPTNPDSMLHVEFFWHEPIDKWGSEVASQEKGKWTIVKLKKQAYVRIMRPGDQTTIIETAVREEHKARWPERWLYWQMAEGLIDDQKVPGWELEEWPYLMEKQDLLRELKFARFQTVDQIAGASDAQVQKMGVGGLGLREQARVDLRNRTAKEAMDEIRKKDVELTEMRERMARLEAALMAKPQEPVAVVPAEKPAKRKYVRKAKPQEQPQG